MIQVLQPEDTSEYDGYRRLFIAIVRQAMAEAMGKNPLVYTTSHQQIFIKQDAIDFLLDRHGDLTWWLDLLDFDAEPFKYMLEKVVDGTISLSSYKKGYL